jgi:NAD(P)-dependent dehydrogenase (short-subunit alcohol dehydrogenase family)
MFLGSITQNGDPAWKFAAVKLIGYSASKAALNMFTVQLAYELRVTPIKVNSADPGFTATDSNDHRGHQTVEEGGPETVRLAAGRWTNWRVLRNSWRRPVVSILEGQRRLMAVHSRRVLGKDPIRGPSSRLR